MGVITLYRIAEQAMNLIEGGGRGAGSSISMNELKIACCQIINRALKIEYFSINSKMGETIPNGSVLGLYEGITPVSWITGMSKATLPIKPLKLPRNMGIWSIYLTNDPENEFIPLQMGQTNLIKSQPLVSTLLGQIGYEPLGGMDISFTKDLPALFPSQTLSMRLAIMDASQYGDYDTLPLPPEFEIDVIKELVMLYSQQPTPDKVVDPTVKENKGVPLIQQKQS